VEWEMKFDLGGHQCAIKSNARNSNGVIEDCFQVCFATTH